MDTAAIMLQIFIWAIIGTILVYLIFRRITIKEKEDFDKRDN